MSMIAFDKPDGRHLVILSTYIALPLAFVIIGYAANSIKNNHFLDPLFAAVVNAFLGLAAAAVCGVIGLIVSLILRNTSFYKLSVLAYIAPAIFFIAGMIIVNIVS